ncbi:MAG: efflux RND transporter periplasmic adaptor subunit, partial [Polyangia bacterium]
ATILVLACALAPGCGGAKAPASQGKHEERGPRPAAVVAAKVEARDVPMYLDGLGTVTAFKTVTVHSLVDGRLDSVAFREGQVVKRGTLLAQVDPRPYVVQLHQAEAALVRDSAQLAGNKLDLDRYTAVAKKKLIAQQQVDDQSMLVGQLDGSVRADRAAIDQAKLMLDYARICSPIDGITGVRLVDPGNLVHPTDPTGIVVVTQIDPIAVLFTLPQDDLPKVSAAMAEGKLAVQALVRDGSAVLATGELGLVDNQINTATATIRLKAIFANPNHVLWPNQFVKARLVLGTQKNALVVPAVAVQNGPSGPFVYLVDADQKATPRPVEVALIQGETAIIGKGVKVGEVVVTEGQFQLKPGAPVEVRGADKGGVAGRGVDKAGAGRGTDKPEPSAESGRKPRRVAEADQARPPR